eukprot:Protomagalhaensia_sp_Gyna_25__1130@NODE_1554_length_1736_cov_17_051267_g1261_i0_p2_GENE_NODE_1554_length_1736_cov_17_051267_g1261_i0NODE_1554_length_1736_cov_17_051267_g1261_i0_p2_ORF_typecomplete_len245_score13_65SRR1/PF07985_12/0_0035_NODE_1554_length_1736_cov_17_051267_g1261_i03737
MNAEPTWQLQTNRKRRCRHDKPLFSHSIKLTEAHGISTCLTHINQAREPIQNLLELNPQLGRLSSTVTHVVTFGLGSPTQSKLALIQTAFLYWVAPRAVSSVVVEPHLTAEDQQLLQQLSIEAVSAIPFVADSQTTKTSAVDFSSTLRPLTTALETLPPESKESVLVFMPHCPRLLVETVFASLVQANLPGAVVVVGNDLDLYKQVSNREVAPEKGVDDLFQTQRLLQIGGASDGAFRSLRIYS